jgi:mannose-6-phosphate isomerase
VTFASDFVPRWLKVACDPVCGGIVERLDADGQPVSGEPKTTLVQARTVFALVHLYLVTRDPVLLEAARQVHGFLDAHLLDPDGGYRVAVHADGGPRDEENCHRRRSYDQSFVLLALVTLARADPGAVATGRIEALWRFVERLTEPATGALYADDRMAMAGARPGEVRAQNPQMHMLEAVLQAYEMTGDLVWMRRAGRYVALARHYFIDRATGAVREFVAHDLTPLEGRSGARREPGHQYEWAWLLHRFADLGGDASVRTDADRMVAFADVHGLRCDGGPLYGAPFDALDADGRVIETSHLLWPLTEAGKLVARQYRDTRSEYEARRIRALERLIFGRFFAESSPCWVNQLDGNGLTLWPEALSRLIYHVVLFVTEGTRVGLWSLEGRCPEHQKKQVEEIT